jgi:hypothetical protein
MSRPMRRALSFAVLTGKFQTAGKHHWGVRFGSRPNTPMMRKGVVKRNGRHEETRTPDLYRVKVAL